MNLTKHKISFDVIQKCFSDLCETLEHVLNLPTDTGVFLDKMRIALVSQIYKADDGSDLTNYRAISVLPCFPKIFEGIKHDRLFSYVSQENILYLKRLCF